MRCACCEFIAPTFLLVWEGAVSNSLTKCGVEEYQQDSPPVRRIFKKEVKTTLWAGKEEFSDSSGDYSSVIEYSGTCEETSEYTPPDYAADGNTGQPCGVSVTNIPGELTQETSVEDTRLGCTGGVETVTFNCETGGTTTTGDTGTCLPPAQSCSNTFEPQPPEIISPVSKKETNESVTTGGGADSCSTNATKVDSFELTDEYTTDELNGNAISAANANGFTPQVGNPESVYFLSSDERTVGVSLAKWHVLHTASMTGYFKIWFVRKRYNDDDELVSSDREVIPPYEWTGEERNPFIDIVGEERELLPPKDEEDNYVIGRDVVEIDRFSFSPYYEPEEGQPNGFPFL